MGGSLRDDVRRPGPPEDAGEAEANHPRRDHPGDRARRRLLVHAHPGLHGPGHGPRTPGPHEPARGTCRPDQHADRDRARHLERGGAAGERPDGRDGLGPGAPPRRIGPQPCGDRDPRGFVLGPRPGPCPGRRAGLHRRVPPVPVGAGGPDHPALRGEAAERDRGHRRADRVDQRAARLAAPGIQPVADPLRPAEPARRQQALAPRSAGLDQRAQYGSRSGGPAGAAPDLAEQPRPPGEPGPRSAHGPGRGDEPRVRAGAVQRQDRRPRGARAVPRGADARPDPQGSRAPGIRQGGDPRGPARAGRRGLPYAAHEPPRGLPAAPAQDRARYERRHG